MEFPVSIFSIEVKVLDIFPELQLVFREEFLSSPHKFFLESSVAKTGFSRFSFMGDASGPLGEALTYNATARQVTILHGDHRETRSVDSFFDFLNERLEQAATVCPPSLPFAFNMGYVGTLGYELKNETIGIHAHPSKAHDGAFLLATRMIAFDHAEHRCYLLHLVSDTEDRQRAAAWFYAAETRMRALNATDATLASAAVNQQKLSLPDVEQWIGRHATMRHKKADYLAKIRQAQQEIINGESYEICLTNIVEFPFDDSPFDLYCAMRQLTPAPHAGYFNIGDFHLACSSPERFLSVDRNGCVEAKPIKGTRPRGRTLDEDARLVADLRGDEKDRAENLMIVDLLRNDLGQVCALSSVHVPKLFDVETYSHVHQLVSTVQGRLKPEVTAVECVRAAFPGGSMTGAPKKRTMEIIDRLEEGPRGTYSGALGWFGLCGACDLNIVIRSIVVDAGAASFGVGGAIIALSDPEAEFAETMVKARGVIEAVEYQRANRISAPAHEDQRCIALAALP
jgi:para-aminobenzoate synthetase